MKGVVIIEVRGTHQLRTTNSVQEQSNGGRNEQVSRSERNTHNEREANRHDPIFSPRTLLY